MRRTGHKLVCPAPNCTGGYAHRVTQISLANVAMPAEVIARITGAHVVYRCSYCGFVWAKIAGNVAPLGFKGRANTKEFTAVPEDYETRST